MYLELAACGPFSLSAVVKSHGWIQLVPFGEEADTATLTYVGRLASGRVVELAIREVDGGVSVDVAASLDEAEQVDLARQVTWMLGLDQDFTSFYELARTEPKLAQAVARRQGRLLRSPTLFEDAVKTILTTNTTWSGTIRMVEALVSEFGTPVPTHPQRHAFPTPEQLAGADGERLRVGAKLGYRAPYVLELAQAVASGTLDLEALKTSTLPTLELRHDLLALKGIGPYAAAHLLIFLERYDFIPVDSWALKLTSHEWFDGAPVSPADVETAFAQWGAWKGLAYWFWDWSYQGT